MAGRAPAPSFSSFPDLNKPKPAPPSFSSFPQQQQRQADEEQQPSKRAKATDFLEGLREELEHKAEGSSSGSSRRSREGSSSRRDSPSRSHREDKKSRSSSSKSKGKERERDNDDKYRHRGSRRSRSEREGERDSDYGENRNKPYQLVHLDPQDEVRSRQPSPPLAAEKPLFYSDRKADDLNVKYGGLHRGDIPRYRRSGAGRVVGLNDGLRITKETAYTGRGVEVGPIRRYSTPRYLDPRSARHITNKRAKHISLISDPPPPRPLALGETPDPSYIPPRTDPFLATSNDPSRFVPFLPEVSTAERLATLEHETGQDYRSIAGMVKASDLTEEGDEAEDDLFGGLGIIGGESQDDYLKRRNLEFDRALRDEPTNVQLWKDFVDFQDEVATTSFIGTATKRALSKSERTSTSEIKLSILDRALAVERNKGSEELLLAYLRAAAEVWDPKKVLERWAETLRSHPTLTGLWIEYVSWRQTSWVNFGVREVVEVFEESFRVLSTAAEKEQFGSQGRELLEGNAIYLFLRLCLMLRQAGFSERALAAFQAILELNLFRPDQDAQPQPAESERSWRDRVLGDLETFWDSEVPRVGETNAVGWKNTPAEAEPLEGPADSFPTPSLAADDHARAHEKWASTEQLTSSANPRPARTTDPGIDDDVDPFRVVLFDDVRDFLFVVHSPDAHLQLVYAFLTFLGLPFIPPDMPTSTPFSTDPFIHSELVERPALVRRFWPKVEEKRAPFALIGGEAMEVERRSALGDPFDTPFHATPTTVDLLFGARQKWFVTLRKEDLQHVDVDLARNALTLLRPSVPDSFLTLDFFAFEACESPKAAVKLAKQLLRTSRQNLVLWDGYARIELQRGKVDEARQVYMTALSMYRSFPSEEQIDGPLLWRAWAEMESGEGRDAVALQVLVAATGADEADLASIAQAASRPSAAQILRARESYASLLESSFQPHVTQAMIRNRNHLAASSAVFEYLTAGLPSAVEVFERHLFRLECSGAQGSSEHEEAFMSYVKLLYRHTEQGKGYKPAQLRDVLERAIKEFRNNTLFLSVFYHNELRMKIQNRVRRTLEDTVLRKDATSEGWLFAIFAELHLDARSLNVWGVRNLFDRALEDPKTRSSPSLWTLYIDFEIRNAELKRAKALINRAVRECPWCKDLYLRPFSPALRAVYRSRELREWYSLLLEKGLRVRVEVDSFAEADFDSDAEEDTVMQEQGSALEHMDEGEELLRERETLKPY